MDGPVATIVVSTPGIHTINVWMREDGFRLDKIVLTTNANATYSGAGPAESPKDGGGGLHFERELQRQQPVHERHLLRRNVHVHQQHRLLHR